MDAQAVWVLLWAQAFDAVLLRLARGRGRLQLWVPKKPFNVFALPGTGSPYHHKVVFIKYQLYMTLFGAKQKAHDPYLLELDY